MTDGRQQEPIASPHRIGSGALLVPDTGVGSSVVTSTRPGANAEVA